MAETPPSSLRHRLALFWAQHGARSTRVLLAGLWAFGIGLLVWIIWANWEEILPFLIEADFRLLVPAFVAFLLSILTATIGWAWLMRPFAPGIPWRRHAGIYAATLVARRLPGTLWYVGGRLILYHRLGVARSFVAFASGLEMVLFVVSGFLLGFTLLPQLPSLDMVVVLLAAASALLLWFSPRLIRYFLDRREVRLDRPPNRLDMLGWISAYIANWLSGGLMIVAILSMFSPPVIADVPYIFGAWALSGAVGTLTIFLPSTFGVVEISLAVFLSRIVPLPLAVVVSILTRILTFAFDFALAAVLYPFVRQAAGE